MKTQGLAGFMSYELSKKVLVFLCILAYAGIHEYDTKWNLPILAWQLIGLIEGSLTNKIFPALNLLSWLYLWVLLRKQNIVINTKIVCAFVGLYAGLLLSIYGQVEVYSILRHTHANFLSFVAPSLLFIILSLLFFRQLKR